MVRCRFSNIATVLCLLFLCLTFSAGQDAPVEKRAENASYSDSVEPFKIMLSVNEVRLDVVVLDKKGNPITDLTAADFEIYQDDRRQEILASVYIDSQSDAAQRSVADPEKVANIPLQPAPVLTKEDVRRTILFVVDDFAMTFENSNYTKMALRNFVEKQMQPGDLVAILRTDYGNSALNTFHSDKRELLARINAMPSAMLSPMETVEEDNKYLQGIYEDHQNRVLKSQPASFSYGIRALKNMPGRRILIVLTPASAPYEVVPTMTPPLLMNNALAERWQRTNELYNIAYVENKDLYDKLANDALRSGVVLNLIDIAGLYNFRSHGADASTSLWRSFNGPSKIIEIVPGIMQIPNQLPTRLPNPLPEKTGGVVIEDSNFFLEGIGKETESLMRGYYLISYAPPQDTFKGRGRKDDYRRLKVRVKREDAKVYTRDGFFGRIESEMDADTPQNPLYAAIYSPFQSTDLNIDIAAGYVKDAKAGYLVRSWIHLDPENVKIIETQDGNRIELEAIYVASDISGNIVDSKRVEFSLSGFNADWVRKHGIRFSTLLPVKKPGPYYIRISVQDKETGNIGSAYQFLEIPDLKKKGLALSNIFIITSADDLAWMSSDVTKEDAEELFFPMFQGEEARSPTLRTYKPGEMLHTLAMLYNADAKAIGRSEIETQTILYKDGKEFMRSNAGVVTMDKVENTGSIPILNRLTVGSNMPPGNYVLQLVVTDKKNRKKDEGAASQTLGFTVVKE